MKILKDFLKENILKLIILVFMVSFTLSIHLSFIPFPHIFHLVHRRLCYFPIVLGALWFSVKGGLIVAFIISLFTIRQTLNYEQIFLNEEFIEIVFYFSLALFSGILVEGIKKEKRKNYDLSEELKRKEKLALQGQMASSVAHEIRTPLSSLKGAFDILKRNFEKNHPHIEFVQIMEEEIGNLEGVVNDFLDLTRPLSIREKSLIEANEATSSAIKSISNYAKFYNVEIDFLRFKENLFFEGDSPRIHQAITNILKNGIQVSPQAKVNVQVNREDEYVKISVEDSGKGIDDSEIEKIFEPFYTKKEGGFGLGLAIVKMIIDAHNGKIRIKNTSNGALFELMFLEKKDG